MAVDPTDFPFERHRDWLSNDRAPSTSYGDGWAQVIGDILDAIGAEMRRHPESRLSLWDLKEKYGTLRCDWMGDLPPELDAAVERICLHAELRSASTCDICGRPGRMLESASRWVAVRCPEHATGLDRQIGDDPPIWKTTDARGTFRIRYDHHGRRVVETPVEESH